VDFQGAAHCLSEGTGDDQAKARARVDEMCKQLLANTVIENYSVEIAN